MSYKITKGDLEITKNVLMELSKKTFNDLDREKMHFEYETECPSYDQYHALVDALCYVEHYRKDMK
jgi:hypothetical protein